MEFKNWLQTLDDVVNNLNESQDAIEAIKNDLQSKNPDLFEKWKNANFDINYSFQCKCDNNYDTYTMLYLCSELGNKHLVDCLLSAGADTKRKISKSPLIAAAKNGFNDIVLLLLKHGAQMFKDSFGKTPLHYATSEGHYETVKTLIQHNAPLNAVDDSKQTPLIISVKSNSFNITKILIESGAQCNDDIIHLAATYCGLETIKYLVEQKYLNVIKVGDGFTTLHCAAKNGDLEVIKYLIEEKKMDPNCKNGVDFSIVHCAAKHGKLDALRYFIEDLNLDYNVYNKHEFETWIPLFYAAVEGHLDVVKYLVEDKKVDINTSNYKGHTALYLASMNNCYSHIIKYLVAKGADINVMINSKKTCLHGAAWNGNMEVIKYFLDVGFKDVYAKDIHNHDCLIKAVMRGKIEAAKYFIEEIYFDLNTVSIDKMNMLHHAVCSRHLEMVEYIINLKGDFLNVRNSYGLTPLNLTAKNGNLEIAELLLMKGADINIADHSYKTPLHRAILNNQYSLAVLLMKYNADINKRDRQSKTALQYAGRNDINILMKIASDKQYKDVLGLLKMQMTYYDGKAQFTSWRSNQK